MKKILLITFIIILILGVTGYYLSTRVSVRLFIAGKITARQIFENEKSMGATVLFSKIKKGWIKYPLKGPMDNIWKYRIKRKGMNYFIMGAPKSIFSSYVERFNPKSKFYQAWFGCYTVLDEKGKAPYGFKNDNPVWKDFIKLAVEDQNAWLYTYGLKSPNTKITEQIKETKIIYFNGHKAFLSFWEGESRSDLNERGSTSSDLNSLLGIPPKKHWNKIVKAHHKLMLKGFFIAWRESPCPATFCCYGCGVKFRTIDGKIIDTFEIIKKDLLEMAKGIKIKPIKGRFK